MQLLVAGGEDRVVTRIESDAVVPPRACPFRTGRVHVAHQIRVVGEQQIGADAAR